MQRLGESEPKSGWGWARLCVAAVLIVGLCYVIFTVGIPTNQQRNKVRAAKTQAMLKVIESSLERYRTDHGDYPHPKYRNETEKIDGIVT